MREKLIMSYKYTYIAVAESTGNLGKKLKGRNSSWECSEANILTSKF